MIHSARVIKGRGQGKQLGFPTFNLEIPSRFNYKFGVYAAKVWLEGKEFTGALHYGPIPTFNHKKSALEIFVLDYNSHQELEEIEFEPIEYIRSVRQFSSLDDLRVQIDDDISKIRKLISKKY